MQTSAATGRRGQVAHPQGQCARGPAAEEDIELGPAAASSYVRQDQHHHQLHGHHQRSRDQCVHGHGHDHIEAAEQLLLNVGRSRSRLWPGLELAPAVRGAAQLGARLLAGDAPGQDHLLGDRLRFAVRGACLVYVYDLTLG